MRCCTTGGATASFLDWGSGNWSEGLTTFQADYAYREDEGADAARAMRLEWLRDLVAIAPADETALATFTSRRHGISSVIGYAKPAMLFFMLRDEIGAAAFDQGLRAFWQRDRFRVAGWKDLEQVFAQASGRDLSAFFAQWTRRAASPALVLAAARAASVRVVQQGEPFDLLVPLRVQLASGATRDLSVRVRERETLVDLAARGLPDAVSVALDPDLRLWRRLEPASVPPTLRETFIAPRAQLHVAATGAEWTNAATALAGRVLDARAAPVTADALLAAPQEPAFVVGDRASVANVLARLGLGSVPQVLVQESGAAAARAPQGHGPRLGGADGQRQGAGDRDRRHARRARRHAARTAALRAPQLARVPRRPRGRTRRLAGGRAVGRAALRRPRGRGALLVHAFLAAILHVAPPSGRCARAACPPYKQASLLSRRSA